MAVMTSALQTVSPNRRRRVRHKIQTPAYATFTGESQGAMLDLHEIVDISEDGVAIQCHSPLELDKRVNLCLDLADCADHLYTTGRVVWSNASGRAGLRFSDLSSESVARLREWLFVNVMAGVANGDAEVAAFIGSRDATPPRPNYTDTLAAVTAVQRQVEALGSDLGGALQLIAGRAQTLVRASGAAIALADTYPDFMVCRASSGADAPPVGAPLQVGSGFSGECVKSGVLLRCDDSEVDVRVDRESCRALGIRSILAVPVRAGDKSIGILEVFSDHPDRFFAAPCGAHRCRCQPRRPCRKSSARRYQAGRRSICSNTGKRSLRFRAWSRKQDGRFGRKDLRRHQPAAYPSHYPDLRRHCDLFCSRLRPRSLDSEQASGPWPQYTADRSGIISPAEVGESCRGCSIRRDCILRPTSPDGREGQPRGPEYSGPSLCHRRGRETGRARSGSLVHQSCGAG